jgi:hypothetical protein
MVFPESFGRGIQTSTREIDQSKWSEDLRKLYEGSIKEVHDEEDRKKIAQMLEDYQDVFSSPDKPLGRTSLVQHRIPTGDAVPIRQPPRRTPLGLESVVQEELEEMKKKGVIEPSASAWASPIVLVKKKDGTLRFCIDYRKLNECIQLAGGQEAYPLPRISDNLDALKGAVYYSTLDLASGYWQIELHPDDREKSAFCTKFGLFHWKVMPFGLNNAPSTFERIMEQVLAGLQWKTAVLYLDDIITFGKDVDEQVGRLREIFERLRKANLQLKPKKCTLFKQEVQFLGHIVSRDGVRTDPEKIKAVKEWSTPTTLKAVRAFLGLTGYYRRFVENYATLASPLIELTKKGVRFKWTEERQSAFEALKEKMISAPILGYPDKDADFILDTDASDCSIGAVLSQKQDGREVVISYGSRVLSKSERNYCVTRRELLAMVWFTEYYKHYLLGKKFLLRTDHGSLRWLFQFREPEGQLARWLEKLSIFQFTIEHRAGTKHGNCDAMSRIPCSGKCKHCNPEMVEQEINPEKKEEELFHAAVRMVVNERTLLKEGGRVKQGRAARIRQRRKKQQNTVSSWERDIKSWQDQDINLQKVASWETKPSWAEVSAENTEVKYYWSRFHQLEKQNGMWKYMWKNSDAQTEVKLIIPEIGRESILREHHNSRIAGHFGVERTYQKVKKSPYFWPKMRETVEQWCQSCDICARTKPTLRKQRAPLQSYLSGATLERIAVDIMGPLCESESGNKYVMVVGDYWSKWMEAYATPDHKAETIALYLTTEFFSRFGIPKQIHTDQGRDFESKLFTELCELLDIDKTRTTPWRPQSDGMVERYNRTLETLLRQVVDEEQTDWDAYLPFVCMAYRSTVHDSTGQTPNMMMLGRELPMPTHLLVQTPGQEERKQPIEFVKQLRDRMQKVHAAAREKLYGSHLKQKKQYDRKSIQNQYKVGTAVWLYNPTRKVGRSPKLQIFWEATPYVVTEIINEVVVKIQRNKEAKPRIVHIDRVKPVKGTVDITWFEELHGNQNENQEQHESETELENIEENERVENNSQNTSPVSILEAMGLKDQEEPPVTRSRVGRPSKPPERLMY